MGKIAVLDKTTIDKIAAGEVVERPASVVKELTENALDAGATMITVELKEGGIGLIRITDNGAGFEKDDIPVAFLRHSTSKIRTVEDLLTVGSLGFRGEALSSISAVAQVELITKPKSAFAGARYVIEGGEERELCEAGCPDGTTFLIRNLFYNIPARRKFLKSATTEAGYCSELVQRIALCRPDTAFKFISNGKIQFQTSGNGNLKEAVYQLFGREITANLSEVEHFEKTAGISVRGYIGKPVIARGNRNYENYFINGRYIRNNVISKAIEEAYRPYMMQHKYPFTVLCLTMDPSLLDVNVHPAKLEVRFSDSEGVYYAVYHAVKDALAGKNMILQVGIGKEEKQETTSVPKKETQPEQFETARMAGNKTFVENQPKVAGEAGKTFAEDQPKTVGETGKTFAEGRPKATGEAGKTFAENSPEAAGETGKTFAENQPKAAGEAGKMFAENLPKIAEKGGKTFAENPLKAGNRAEENAGAGKKEEAAGEEDRSCPKDEKAGTESKKENTLQEAPETYLTGKRGDKETQQRPGIPEQIELPNLLDKNTQKEYRIIGQVFATYWLIEMENQLFMIDQHAAHEKILFEQTMKRIREKDALTQQLSPPYIASLSIREEEVLKEQADILQQLGFEFENFGGREYKITGVPADLYGLSGGEFFMTLLDGLVAERLHGSPEVVLEKVASMSCKAAVKGNMRLSEAEAKAMIDLLLTLDDPYHCPHGRPTTISMSRQEIERKFKRIV